MCCYFHLIHAQGIYTIILPQIRNKFASNKTKKYALIFLKVRWMLFFFSTQGFKNKFIHYIRLKGMTRDSSFIHIRLTFWLIKFKINTNNVLIISISCVHSNKSKIKHNIYKALHFFLFRVDHYLIHIIVLSLLVLYIQFFYYGYSLFNMWLNNFIFFL